MSKQNKMTLLRAIEIAESDNETTDEEYINAWQYLIDSGQAWTLQGWYGRVASSLIQQGICYYTINGTRKKQGFDGKSSEEK